MTVHHPRVEWCIDQNRQNRKQQHDHHFEAKLYDVQRRQPRCIAFHSARVECHTVRHRSFRTQQSNHQTEEKLYDTSQQKFVCMTILSPRVECHIPHRHCSHRPQRGHQIEEAQYGSCLLNPWGAETETWNQFVPRSRCKRIYTQLSDKNWTLCRTSEKHLFIFFQKCSRETIRINASWIFLESMTANLGQILLEVLLGGWLQVLIQGLVFFVNCTMYLCNWLIAGDTSDFGPDIEVYHHIEIHWMYHLRTLLGWYWFYDVLCPFDWVCLMQYNQKRLSVSARNPLTHQTRVLKVSYLILPTSPKQSYWSPIHVPILFPQTCLKSDL